MFNFTRSSESTKAFFFVAFNSFCKLNEIKKSSQIFQNLGSPNLLFFQEMEKHCIF